MFLQKFQFKKGLAGHKFTGFTPFNHDKMIELQHVAGVKPLFPAKILAFQLPGRRG